MLLIKNAILYMKWCQLLAFHGISLARFSTSLSGIARYPDDSIQDDNGIELIYRLPRTIALPKKYARRKPHTTIITSG